jgi:long-subunit acyl-CoA synthetase (AMP-forming)
MIEAFPWVRQVALIGDQRPYVSALVVVNDDVKGDPGASLGLLDPSRHPELYERARRDFAQLNTRLEAIERVQRFLLFGAPMADDLHAVVGLGKRRRDRKRIDAAYVQHIARLYSDDAIVGTLSGAAPSRR